MQFILCQFIIGKAQVQYNSKLAGCNILLTIGKRLGQGFKNLKFFGVISEIFKWRLGISAKINYLFLHDVRKNGSFLEQTFKI
jgi:hypothetical protein